MTHDLAVSLGDPRGIGAEVVRAAMPKLAGLHPEARLLVFGAEEARTGLGAGVTFEPVGSFGGSPASAGLVALRAIEAGVRACLEGRAGALVTAPIHKPALRSAGCPFPGHTELLQDLTGSASVGMLMAAETTSIGGPLRVLLATTHMALREVPAHLSIDLFMTQTELLSRELRRGWGISRPRIALCAVNPHASDEGLFGREEAEILTPAMERLRADGIEAFGPIPADTVFTRALAGEFDAVVAPYHDVGMAPFKTVSFGRGVNVTLGLPFPRTSPDHGTAFALVGTGLADPTSTLEAMSLALRLARGDLPDESGPPVRPASARAGGTV